MLPLLATVTVTPVIPGGSESMVTATLDGESLANVPLMSVTVPDTVLGVGTSTNGGSVPLMTTLLTETWEKPLPASTEKSATPVMIGAAANVNVYLPSGSVKAVNEFDRVTQCGNGVATKSKPKTPVMVTFALSIGVSTPSSTDTNEPVVVPGCVVM